MLDMALFFTVRRTAILESGACSTPLALNEGTQRYVYPGGVF